MTASGLPDPLTHSDGSPVSDAEDWYASRRRELHDLFEANVYGPPPALPTDVEGRVTSEKDVNLGARARIERVALTMGGLMQAELLLMVPAGDQGPAPCLAGFNFSGNDDVLATAEQLAAGAKRPPGTWSEWPLGEAALRGYAVATLRYSELVPDEAEEALALLRHLNSSRGALSQPGGSGALSCWAWGLSRLVDYLERRPEIDAQRIAVFGHSRLGKAALLAGARDDRFAVVIAHQSGCGGAAPWRAPRHLWPPDAGPLAAETLAAITRRFGYWFCERLASFGDDPDALPVDQHQLIALCAPRPVLLTNGAEDHWIYPSGQRKMLEAAAAVYRLVCGPGERVIGAPPEEGRLASERLGWFVRPGGHSTTAEDWRAWLDYADCWL